MASSRVSDFDELCSVDSKFVSYYESDFGYKSQPPEIIFSIEREHWIEQDNDFNKLLKFLKIYKTKGIIVDETLFSECIFIGIIRNKVITEFGELLLTFENSPYEKCYVKVINQMCEKDRELKGIIAKIDLRLERFSIPQNTDKIYRHLKFMEVIGIVKEMISENEYIFFQVTNKNAIEENIDLWKLKKQNTIFDAFKALGFAASGLLSK
jgi:hypothetical protein